MIEAGVEHGQTFDSTFFEAELKEKRDTMRFGLAISEIRRELEKVGYYLSGRGQHGNQFIILMPQDNCDVMLSYQRSAIDAMKRGVILGTQTRLDLLSDQDRRKHESVLERLALRTVLVSRSKQIKAALGDKAEKLLAQKT